MTVSYWRRSANPQSIECDVAIIGAGVCGLSAALHLQRRGLRVEILERHTTGSGASTRNAGFLMRGAADNYKLAIDEYGHDLAKLVWRLSEENLAGLKSEGIGSLDSVRDVPSVLLALEPGELAELQASLELLKRDGFNVEWMQHGSDALWRASGASRKPLGALVNPDDASCNSAHVIQFLASKLAVPVREHQEVFRIGHAESPRPSTRLLAVHTSDFLIRCDRVLVCTNAFAPLLLPQLAQAVMPRRGQMLAYRVPSDFRLSASYYANRGSEYFRQAWDGTIVVGGCRTYHADLETGYDDTLTPWVQRDLERFSRDIFGPIVNQFSIVARWAGTMGFSPDGLPLVGPIPNSTDSAAPQWEDGRVWFCGAFTGHGMSLAYRISRLAIDAMLDGAANPLPLARAAMAQAGVPRV